MLPFGMVYCIWDGVSVTGLSVSVQCGVLVKQD